jgi:hypothetical protein
MVYYDFEIIQKSLSCFLKNNHQLDHIVIENKSNYTDTQIKPYIKRLLEQDKISKYYYFEKNITNNAFETVIDLEINNFKDSKYIILTDGDLYVKNDNWLVEEIEILEKYPEVFACAISLDDSNLPIKNFPDAYKWLEPPIEEYKDYIEAYTGVHLLLLRTNDFINYWKYREKKNLTFVDSTMHYYCYQVAQKKWARTKNNKAIHITWDRYNDLNHPYTQLKLSKTLQETWFHNEYSSYELHTNTSIIRHIPWSKIARGYINSFRKKINQLIMQPSKKMIKYIFSKKF